MPPKRINTPKGKTSSHVAREGAASWRPYLKRKDILVLEQTGEDEPRVFVSSGVLHGVLLAKDEVLLHEGASGQEHYVYIHPHTMEACELSVGSTILLTTSDHSCSATGVVWSANKLNLDGIAVGCSLFKSLKAQPGSIVCASQMSNTACRVSKLHLTPCSCPPFPLDQVFIRYFLQRLDRRVLFLNNHVSVLFGGQQLSFTATSALILSCAVETTSNSFISDQLSSLSLQDPPSSTSTPVKTHGESTSAAVDLSAVESPVMQSDTIEHSLLADFRQALLVISGETDLVIESTAEVVSSSPKQRLSSVSFADVGGLNVQIDKLRKAVLQPMTEPELLSKLGGEPPRGLLLYGPAGTGKKLLVWAVAGELKAPIFEVSGADVISHHAGHDDVQLQNIFHQASQQSRAIIMITGLDQLCPSSPDLSNEAHLQAKDDLRTLMHDLHKNKSLVVVLATAEQPVHKSLRGLYCFRKEIEVTPPTAAERTEILSKMLRRVLHSLSTDDIEQLAQCSHGYVGSDLELVVSSACDYALWRAKDSSQANVKVSVDDFQDAFREIPPSAMRGISLEVPKVRWSDIGGEANIKKQLRHVVEWPLKYSKKIARAGISPRRGALLYGPPGCSKTMIARALATESGLNFLAVKGPELFDKYVGESERAVREVFHRARAAAPSIIFFDELDALAIRRGGHGESTNTVGDRLVGQLLVEMDGLESRGDIVVIAATNRPDMIDQALLRPGRFDVLLYVPLPDEDTRREIFKLLFRRNDYPVSDDVKVDDLAAKTRGYSGAEVVNIFQKASDLRLEEELAGGVENISFTLKHFEHALLEVQPMATDDLIRRYEDFGRQQKPIEKKAFTFGAK